MGHDYLPHDYIPHSYTQALKEVGALVGLFVLAMGCLACCLGGPRYSKLSLRRRGADDDDDDASGSYIEDAGSGAPAPHVFESLNELVFFEAPDNGEGGGFLVGETSANDETDEEQGGGGGGLFASMDQIFPDILGPGTTEPPAGDGANGGSSNSADLREPLL